jgi:phage FluMu gp28-like protein
MAAIPAYFLPYQKRWVLDMAPLKLMQKSRQIGISYTDAYDSVRKVCRRGARLDVWISSRDETQAKLYVEDCKNWARILQLAARDLGHIVLDQDRNCSGHVLEFSSGLRIYSLSSNPNALAGKRGHVKLDEFALHPDQRLLYRVAKPVTTWGGTLSIISTHRGATSVFNQLITEILERGNPMGWSLHTVPINRAVDQGLVQRINLKTGAAESRDSFLKRIRAECIDEEQWLQEYCCVPADESTAFISFELINRCADPDLRLLTIDQLCSQLSQASTVHHQLYLGVDVARKQDLCVLDVGHKIGDVTWDLLRLELRGKPFSEIESELYRILQLRQLKRACLDASGLGLQLAERAVERFGWKVEPVTFTRPVKEELAFGIRSEFEDRKLRIVSDEKLRADLRGIRKEVSAGGNLRFDGDTDDSHCDRFWAKALRQHAARHKVQAGAALG